MPGHTWKKESKLRNISNLGHPINRRRIRKRWSAPGLGGVCSNHQSRRQVRRTECVEYRENPDHRSEASVTTDQSVRSECVCWTSKITMSARHTRKGEFSFRPTMVNSNLCSINSLARAARRSIKKVFVSYSFSRVLFIG